MVIQSKDEARQLILDHVNSKKYRNPKVESVEITWTAKVTHDIGKKAREIIFIDIKESGEIIEGPRCAYPIVEGESIISSRKRQ